MQSFYMFILCDDTDRLNVDVTSNLLDCKQDRVEKQSASYGKNSWNYKLIYFERFRQQEKALARKRDIHSWKNEKLLELVDFVNPERYDLASDRDQLKSVLNKQ